MAWLAMCIGFHFAFYGDSLVVYSYYIVALALMGWNMAERATTEEFTTLVLHYESAYGSGHGSSLIKIVSS